jgi:hypothetical protein
MTQKILTCVCEHDYQDQVYGSKKRVCNQVQKPDTNHYRCTVCGKVWSSK